jgi:hypothetical protein
MVLDLILGLLVSFVWLAFAAYAGTLRALEVYHDPLQDSVFLPDDARRPER